MAALHQNISPHCVQLFLFGDILCAHRPQAHDRFEGDNKHPQASGEDDNMRLTMTSSSYLTPVSFLLPQHGQGVLDLRQQADELRDS